MTRIDSVLIIGTLHVFQTKLNFTSIKARIIRRRSLPATFGPTNYVKYTCTKILSKVKSYPTKFMYYYFVNEFGSMNLLTIVKVVMKSFMFWKFTTELHCVLVVFPTE